MVRLTQFFCAKTKSRGSQDTDFVFDYTSAFDFKSAHTFNTDKKHKTVFKYHDRDYIVDITECEQEPWQSAVFRAIVTVLCYVVLVATFPLTGWLCVKRVTSLERMAIFRLGKLMPVQGPGIVIVFPGVDNHRKIDLRPRTIEIEPRQILLGDGAVVELSCSLACQVVNSVQYVTRVREVDATIRLLCQHCLSSVVCIAEQEDLERRKESLESSLLTKLNDSIIPWGLEVIRVTIQLDQVIREAEPVNAISPLVKVLKSALGLAGDDYEDKPSKLLGKIIDGKSPKAGALHIVPAVPNDGQFTQLTMVLQQLAIHAAKHEALIETTASYKFLLHGAPGSDVKEVYPICLIFDKGNVDVKSGSTEVDAIKPDVTLEMTSDDLTLIVLGKMSPLKGYMGGKISVKGDWNLLKKFIQVVQGK
ncbi:stomatin-like protein 1 isoform X1 [Varroa jacobsoni]|uniref:Band 7 domain-containing protein n=1 Tax=Varroa destructor TaxID=109461 RepID=A0A7M7MJN4_VARDE|nr:stomatin-like protein 1 isoform X3 [Varroa destructor]XP_022691297.1 stomatin-like protein 1 isoform X1 [Varroa jacobsoni]XP_022691298.1 stomatin-like protein 1 isoform X1 [Varroa jacobsoni]